MENEHQTTTNNEINPIILDSPVNFNDELRKFNVIYLIIAFITILLVKNPQEKLVCTIFFSGAGGFLITNIISTFKVDFLRQKEFEFKGSFSKDQIASFIAIPLTKLGMTVELVSDYIRITHNSVEYDVVLIPENGVFKIWPQKNTISWLISGRVYLRLYKKSIFTMPIIAYTIQYEINKALNNTVFTEDYESKINAAMTNPNVNTKVLSKRRNKIIALIVAVVLLLCFLSGNSSHYVDIVKDGTLNYNQTQKVGRAFDQYFSNSNWRYFKSDTGTNIVEFKGYYNVNSKKKNVLIQFEVYDNSDEFELAYFEINGEPQNYLSWWNLLDKIY